MTEIAGLGTTHAVYAPPVPGTIGVALPGIEVRVADLEDVTRDAPPGVPGELMVRGPIVMMGYFGNPDETARTIETPTTAWPPTSDRARWSSWPPCQPPQPARSCAANSPTPARTRLLTRRLISRATWR
jgi:long-chain acyl-CoA synthetase